MCSPLGLEYNRIIIDRKNQNNMATLTQGIGLQILLQPYSNHGIGEAASVVVGTLYPAYASFKAIEYMRVHGDTDEATRWLMYWAIFGLFNTAEKLLNKLGIAKWVPYYPSLKLAFLLWLQLPRFGGAYRMTAEYVRPFLHEYYPYIDEAVLRVKESFSRQEIVNLLDALQGICARIPVLEWFMRFPDGKRYIPPPPPSRIL